MVNGVSQAYYPGARTSSENGGNTGMSRQSTSTIMMVRPAAFQSNPETAESNAFQDYDTSLEPKGIHESAVQEFDSLVQTLRQAGVNVVVVEDLADPKTPDAVFPNNWITTHRDGTVITYPMMAKSRRLERRPDVYEDILPAAGFSITQHIDLSSWESQGRYLEGTGSLVLDREHRIAYACRAPRTDDLLVVEFSQQLNYRTEIFDASDRHGLPIYHTNVLMCIGTGYAVICGDAIVDSQERDRVLNRLEQTGHELILLTFDQLEDFAGNMLELKNNKGERLLAMSSRAHASLREDQKSRLGHYATVISSPIRVIEDNSGGSVRCMMAEIFLPTE